MNANFARSQIAPVQLGASAPFALELFDRLPIGHLAYAIPDHSCAPLLRQGEIAIIDPADRLPLDGAIHLKWCVNSWNEARISLVENVRREIRDYEDRDAEPSEAFWFVAHNRPKSVGQWADWAKTNGPIPMADGPWLYEPSNQSAPFNKLVGRVVGILATGADMAASDRSRSNPANLTIE